MKLRLSIRLYFLAAMLLLGICIVSAFTVLTANYFIEGRESALRDTMIQLANTKNVSDTHPVEIIGYQITSHWQDVSPDIKQALVSPPEVIYNLKKRIESGSFLKPPKAAYFAMKTKNKNGDIRYIATSLQHNLKLESYRKRIPHFLWIFVFGISGIVIFSLLLLLIMRTIARPVEALRNWARSLNETNLTLPPPDFRYNELNTLAQIVHSSLNSVQESLDREHDFLRYASHELRTPISVIKANIELLRKINEQEKMSDKQRKVVERIERAGVTMSHLTETLLWLSRGNQISLTRQKVNLKELVLNLTEELNYLLQGKSVEVQVKTSNYILELPETACRIVLTNLIRNAFQHTQNGVVNIIQNQNQVTIQNTNSENNEDKKDNGNELGYGLGLKLTDKLIHQFDWQYHSKVQENGHIVEVIFV